MVQNGPIISHSRGGTRTSVATGMISDGDFITNLLQSLKAGR